ncbi:MAG: hypothetical protein ACLQMF_07285 [Rectinemataceae bacterium]
MDFPAEALDVTISRDALRNVRRALQLPAPLPEEDAIALRQ